MGERKDYNENLTLNLIKANAAMGLAFVDLLLAARAVVDDPVNPQTLARLRGEVRRIEDREEGMIRGTGT